MKKILSVIFLLFLASYLLIASPIRAEDPPPSPGTGVNIVPQNYSFEKSIGNFNEYTEGNVHSGTRENIGVDASDPNNYGATAALVPAGGPNHELRVNFVKERGDYSVSLENGTPKKVKEIWDTCTNNGDINKWQEYLEKLNNCSDWGFIPTTYRRLANEPSLNVEAKTNYFQENQSPFVTSLLTAIPFLKDIQNAFCSTLGLFCEQSLALRNPDNAPGWTKGKPNIPLEATDNARQLRQFLLPENFPLGSLPAGNNSYFNMDDSSTQTALNETGSAAQEIAAEGGLLKIFQPLQVIPSPPLCEKDSLNPTNCASAFYFKLSGSSTTDCPDGLCHTDTPDQKTDAPERPTDGRPESTQTQTDFTQNSLWPLDIQPNF